MRFNVEIVLPSGKKIRVNELKNREYLNIIKFCHNDDLVGLAKYFESLFNIDNLNIIERFYVLIYIRMIFVDSEIIFMENGRQVKLDLATMLDKIESSYIDLERTVSEKGIEVTLDLPKISYFESIDDLYIATISNIKIGSDSIDFDTITEVEKSNILSNMPASIFKHIESYIVTIQDNLLSILLIDENKELGITPVEINIVSNGVLRFISSLYKTSLEDFYNLTYLFQNTVLPGSSLFLDMSPIESQIVLNAHHKKIKKQNDELQKQQNR